MSAFSWLFVRALGSRFCLADHLQGAQNTRRVDADRIDAQGHQRHALVMRHERTHCDARLARRQAGGGVVDGLVEAEAPEAERARLRQEGVV